MGWGGQIERGQRRALLTPRRSRAPRGQRREAQVVRAPPHAARLNWSWDFLRPRSPARPNVAGHTRKANRAPKPNAHRGARACACSPTAACTAPCFHARPLSFRRGPLHCAASAGPKPHAATFTSAGRGHIRRGRISPNGPRRVSRLRGPSSPGAFCRPPTARSAQGKVLAWQTSRRATSRRLLTGLRMFTTRVAFTGTVPPRRVGGPHAATFGAG